MQPATEYVPEVRKSRPTWKPNKKLPDYGPVIGEPPRPRHSIDDSAKSYQKIQYSEPFHPATPVTEFVNEPHVLDPIESTANKINSQPQSSLREPLRYHATYDDQRITKTEWHQRLAASLNTKEWHSRAFAKKSKTHPEKLAKIFEDYFLKVVLKLCRSLLVPMDTRRT